MIGSLLRSRYELTGLVTDGPIFAAYSARDRLSGKDVCVRVVKQPFASEEPFLQALSKAVKKHSAVHSSGVEAMTDVDLDEGMAFVVGELTRGPHLADRIRKLAPFSIPVSVGTGISICQALDSVHRLGFVHGDLQSSNLAVLADGEIRLQLTGIWEAYSASPTAGGIVMSGMAPYMAPEVSAGGMPSAQSDVYAVGIILFELLTGRKPYTAENPVATVIQHTNVPTPAVRSVNPSTPVVLNEIVRKAMAKDPRERYANAGELLSDLRILQDALRFGRSLSWPLRGGANVAPKPAAPHQPVTPKMGAVKEVEQLRAPKAERDVPIWMVIAASMLLAVLGSLIGVWFIFNLSKPKLIPVPNVRNLSASEARSMLESSHLHMDIPSRALSDQVEMDHVIDIDPEPGAKVKEGGFVHLTISAGSHEVQVPDLTGDTLDGAKTILGNLNLTLDPNSGSAWDPSRPEKVVVKQDPPAQTKVDRSTVVKVFLNDPEGPPLNPPKPAIQTPAQTPDGTTPTQPAPTEPAGTTTPKKPAYTPLEPTNPGQTKEYTVNVKLDTIANPTRVRLDITDDDGTRTVIDEMHNPGESLRIQTDGTGKQVTFTLYYDGQEQGSWVQKPKGRG